MACRAHRFPIVRIAAAVGIALVLASCAAVQQHVDRWFGTKSPAPSPTPEAPSAAAAQAPRVYYVGVDELKVYSEPSASSKVVGTFTLHEKVTRTKLERGYAYVESSKTAVKGWVTNAQLIWRLPAASTTAAPAPAQPEAEQPVPPETPQVVEPTATPTESLPEPTNTPVSAPPSSKATPRGVGPSIFNPY